MTKSQIITTLVIVTAAVAARAQYTEIDLRSQVNVDIQNYTDGHNYQLGGTQLIVSGVPFALAELNNNPNTTGVVQGGGPSETGQFNYTFLMPAGMRATVLYTLLNTADGEPGVNEGSIVVTGTGGETATLNLIEGYNIRDHNNDGFVNTLSDPTVVPTYFLNGAPTTLSIQTRLDRQQLILPGTFSGDTIASITFQGDAQGEYYPKNGAAFLAAMTLQTVQTQVTNLVTITATAEAQGGTNDNGTVTTIKKPTKLTLDTKQILAFLAEDEYAEGEYASTNFPTGAKLVVIGGDFQVLDKTNNFLVDVSDILSIEKGTNDIVSGKINDSTGLYENSATKVYILRISYDDSGISGGAGLQFYLAGLMRCTVTNTAPNESGFYTETDSDRMDASAGQGHYQDRSFVITGSLTLAGIPHRSPPPTKRRQ